MIGRGQLRRVGNQATKAEALQSAQHAHCIFSGRLDEDVQVFGQTGFNVEGEGVRANQKKLCVLREKRVQEV